PASGLLRWRDRRASFAPSAAAPLRTALFARGATGGVAARGPLLPAPGDTPCAQRREIGAGRRAVPSRVACPRGQPRIVPRDIGGGRAYANSAQAKSR